MLNTLNINLKTDIKNDRATALGIKLMSQDKNNNQFILRFTNGGEPVTLDDTYTVEILTKFQNSGASRLTSATVRQDYATWEFDTAYITQDETVYNYVYVRKAGSLVVSADANAFYFEVGLSEIDKGAGRVAEVYDENYQKYLDEFKDNVDFEEIAQAEQARKEAELLREENYNQKVDTAIVEADVVEKVDSKVTELTPQINSLIAQLAQKTDKGYVDDIVDSVDRGYGGTYNTLSELESAFPTGNEKRYVVADDGNWYYWNGSWISGGTFQSTGIANNSIKLEGLGEDLQDAYWVKNFNFTYGSITSATGVWNERLDRASSEPTNFKRGDIITIPNQYALVIAWLDGEGNFEGDTYAEVGWIWDNHYVINEDKIGIVTLCKKGETPNDTVIPITEDEILELKSGTVSLFRPSRLSDKVKGNFYYELGGLQLGANSISGKQGEIFLRRDTSFLRGVTEFITFNRGDKVEIGGDYVLFVFMYDENGEFIGAMPEITYESEYIFARDCQARIVVKTPNEDYMYHRLNDAFRLLKVIKGNISVLEENRNLNLVATAGTTFSATMGGILDNYPNRMAVREYQFAHKGSTIEIVDENYQFAVITFSGEVDPDLIYTFTYAPESDWMLGSYNHDSSGYSTNYGFKEDCWFRLAVKRVDDEDISQEEANNINNILKFRGKFDVEEKKIAPYFKREIEKTAESIYANTTKESLVLGLVTDTHLTINGTWNDTAKNIKSVHDKVGFDGVVHLGDVTDGRTKGEVTRKLTYECLDDLMNLKSPLYLNIGNHDTNYQYPADVFTHEQQYAYFMRFMDRYVNREGNNLYYYVDYDNIKIRCLFLDSFENNVYGFSEDQLTWVQSVLDGTPTGYSVVVFTHVPPLSIINYGGTGVVNGEQLVTILENYNSLEGKNVIGYFNGHTHSDYVYTENSFPIIGIGCAKCEYVTQSKPSISKTEYRELGTVTQDLWDTLIITPEDRTIKLIRFGAGGDRTVSY